MHDLDIQISGDNSIVDLELSSLGVDICLSIHNDLINPADTLHLIAPKTNHKLEWQSKIKTNDPTLDLMILLNNDTHIHDGSFVDFERVMITNHKILERTNNAVSLDDNNNSYAIKLIIENFRTGQGLIFCSHLALIASGIAKDFLCINLEAQEPQLKLIGIDDRERFTVGNLQINSSIKKLTMSNVLVRDSFTHQNIDDLFIENTLADGNFNLSNIGSIRKLELSSTGHDSKIYCNNIEISNLFTPQGKFYIAAKSYIDFKINQGGRLVGIDLVLDMSSSDLSIKKVSFPACKFSFNQINVLGASEVAIPLGGSCKQLIFDNCESVSAHYIIAQNIVYKIQDKQGALSLYSSTIGEHLIVAGKVNISLSNFESQNIEAYGLCRLSLTDNILIKMLKLNLDLNVSNPGNIIPFDSSVITIDNSSKHNVQIDNILAKLSTLHIKGGAKLGTVLIVPIDKIPTLFWIEMTTNNSMLMDRLFVGGNHDIVTSPDGSINIVRNHNMLTGSSVYASVSSATAKDYIHVKAGKGIRFDGKIHVINAVGLFTESGDIIINGHVVSENSIVLAAKQGEIITTGATLEAKAIAVYSHSSSYFHDTLIKAQELVAYSLNGYVQITQSQIKVCNIAIIANGDIDINSSTIQSSNSYFQSGQDVTLNNSDIISYSIYVQSIHDFLQINSNINLVHYPHVLFANQVSMNASIIKGGVHLATDVSIIGLYGEAGTILPATLAWKQVADINKATLSPGSAYIEADRGFIIGSTLDAGNSVIIKTHNSIEVVPLTLYNETIDSGGLNKKSIIEVVSKINAGLIQIDASKSAIFVASMLKAASGIVDSKVVFLLNSPESITHQQQRIKTLTGFINSELPENTTVADYFNFSKSTHIASAISNLNVYSEYSSPELYFTQKQGDIALDRSITKYEKLQVTASCGKILITSPNLQDIYKGNGGGDVGKESSHNARTVIGGGDVYLVADEVISEAGKFNVSGELKIVAKDGVYMLPVSVHQSLMYHKGSKTTISEYEVRLVVSEINAGFLNIKAGGAFTAVSTLIKATGINLDVGELNLLSEREIFEKRIVFEGKEKWHGGSNESMDYFRDELVIPTLIKSDSLHAKVNGKTTIEAAQILVKEESILAASGDVSILAKYDIHLHDHESSKSYLFNFHKGKLTVAGTKTVKEHFYGEIPVPTIYYNQGDFYGCSDGSIHLLGSKIIANNLYLVAEKGIKLEASEFHQEQIVSISKEGVRIGFSSGGGKHSVDAEFFSEQDKQQYSRTFHDASELIARNHLTLQTPEQIEIISSKLKFTTATVKARGLYMHTHANIVEQQQQQTAFSMGLYAGIQENISSTVNTVGKVLNKTGVHWLDILDRALNGYTAIEGIKDIYQDVEQLTTLDPKNPKSSQSILDNLKSVQYGVWVGAKASTSISNTKQTQAVDNEIIGGDIEFDIVEDAVIEGITCNVDNFRLKARNLFATASHDTVERETYSSNIEITIPIAGSVGASVSGSYKQSESISQTYHSDNVINVTGKLELDLSENGEIKGIRLQSDIIDIKAKNLVVESLQDVLKERMRGMDISVGIGGKDARSFGAKAQMQERDKVWTGAIASIIGREVVNVTVQQTLEVAGSLIANADIAADGTLTDKGKANIQAGKIIAKTLHNYDNGYSYGLGINLSKSANAKTGEIKHGVKVPVIYSFNESNRDLLPTIGQGTIDLTEAQNPTGLLNRDISQHIGSTTTNKASLDASLPISDIWEAIKPKTGINAGDDYDYQPYEEEDEKSNRLEEDEKTSKFDAQQEQITSGISKEALHDALLILKASEVGYSVNQLVNDPIAYNTSKDILDLDLTVAALNKFADTHDGTAAGVASRISKELVDIRQEVIKGGPSFSSIWEKTKDNLKSGKTSILNPIVVNLDVMGNMVSYVEDKVGYILSSNMPKTSATLKAGLGYTMEKIIKNGIEGAVEVFGQESVESTLNSLKKGLNWVDETSTKGHQKLLEYSGIYAATKVLSKVISAAKHNKVPHLSEDMLSSLSKQEAYGVNILEKNGLNDELRNFSTAHQWENFADHINHLESKLPDIKNIKTFYPDGKDTFGIKKTWNKGYSEVVIKKAQPDSEHACQQVDYVSIRSNGQILTKDGNFIIKRPDGLYKELPQKNNSLAPDPNTGVKLPQIEGVNRPYKHPDAHIPLSEWRKWKEWNKPK